MLVSSLVSHSPCLLLVCRHIRDMDRGADIGEDPWIVNWDAIDFVQEVEVNEDAEDANFSADNALENQTDGCLAEE